MSNTLSIISDTKNLKRRVKEVMARYQSVGTQVHQLVVSALHHAATTGQPAPLNAIHEHLRPNDQQALKLFIRRASAMNANNGQNPDGLPADAIQLLVDDGSFLTYTKGEYKVTHGHTSERSVAFAKLCEDKLINPDGKDVRFVLDTNNVVETKMLGDADILKKIVELKRQLKSGERKVVSISPKVEEFVIKTSEQAEQMLKQTQLSA